MFEDVIDHIALVSHQSLTQRLRSLAINAGWPEDAAEAVTIVHKNGDIEISVDPKYEKIVNNLEYGTETQPPNSVIRKFTAGLSSELEDFIAPSFSKFLPKIVENI